MDIDSCRVRIGVEEVQPLKIEVKRLHPNAIIPAYQSDMAAGLDLHACIDHPIRLEPGETRVVSTGLAIYIGDRSIVGKVYPRSGLGVKKGLVLGNLTGVIDADYQGPALVPLWNRTSMRYQGIITINPGDRIAQLVFERVLHPSIVLVDEFSSTTARGEGGFGSTGVAAA